MQENNNFQKIISQWRRLSGEQIESAALLSMSGDSHHQNKIEEDSEKDVLVPGRMPMSLAGASAAAAIVEPAVTTALSEEKQELVDPAKDKEETKEASGDSPSKDEKEKNSENLENNDNIDKSLESQLEKEKGDKGDKVDSVYLGHQPPHKTRSNTSITPAEEEDCGVTCLYYTLQCCDCVLM